jgi:Tfp pilus assembly protein PilO
MSESRHVMLAVGLFFAVLVLGGIALILPNAREISNIRDREHDLQHRSKAIAQTGEVVAQLSRMLLDAQQTIDTELKQIPDEPGIASLIRRLSLAIDHETVLDQTFKVGAAIEPLPEAHPAIRAIPVTMEMKGTFDSTFAAIRSIESMDRLLRLRSIRTRTIEDQLKQHGQPIIETVIMIEAVYQVGDSQS